MPAIAGRHVRRLAAPSATADEIAQALAFALQYQGRKRRHDADGLMAKITAERLVRHLEASGFVLMKRPPLLAHSTSALPPCVPP
jgi:hypothetical protein